MQKYLFQNLAPSPQIIIEAIHPLQLLSLAVLSLRKDLIGEPLIKTMHGMS